MRVSERAYRAGALVVLLVGLGGCGAGSGEEPAAAADKKGIHAGVDGALPATRDSAATARVASVRQAVMPPLDPGGCLGSNCHSDLLDVAYRHEPAQKGACEACHEPEQPEHKFPLKRTGIEACVFCHPVIGHKKHVHEVITKDGCLVCHDPHGTNAKFLLEMPGIEMTCQRCHPLERKSHLHGPFAAGECATCHQPHESDNRFLLRGGEGKAHCFFCHEDKRRQLQTAPLIHKPLEEGCVGCHTPHSSDYAHGLTAPLETLCFACHPDVQGTVTAAVSPHGAVFTGDRCANCHDPHAAGRPYLLRDDLRSLCLQCHDKPQEAYDGRTIPDMRPVLNDRRYLHGPVRAGECNACHLAHGSRYRNLLREYFPTEFYLPFDPASYVLCFQCHSSAIVQEKETDTLTNFRDGSRNLHYLHVHQPEKGRTCRTCHEIHGSNLPLHMASEVPFEGGDWSMPIRYEKTRDGGRCSPGCHESLAYSRRAPLNPPATDAAEESK